MTLLGYALVALADGAIIQRVASTLPVRIAVESVGVCDFDMPGQVMPDAENPSHVFVERVLNSNPPTGQFQVTGESETFDGTRVVLTRTYQSLPDPVPEQISDRQFAQALRQMSVITQAEALAFVQTGTIPAALQTVIDGISDQETKDNAELLLAGATVFERHHPMTDALRAGIGWTAEQTDNLWRTGASL